MDWKQINWSDPAAKISPHFNVKDAIWLKELGRLATEADGLDDAVKEKIVQFFNDRVEPVRELLGIPMFSKSCFRPEFYNKQIGGAKLSCHRFMLQADGKRYGALDFWCDADGDGDKDGADCDELKKRLMPNLEDLEVRMEDNGWGARWIHVDDKPVPPNGQRFFKP